MVLNEYTFGINVANWSTVFCLLVTFFILVSYLNNRPSNFPPGPRGVPIFGVAPFISRRPELTFTKWSLKYGDIIGFKLGKDNVVVLSSYDKIREALVRKSATFSHRPDNYVFRDVMKKKGVTFSDYTPEYIVERKFLHSTINRLGFGKTSIEEAFIEEVQHFFHLLGDGDVELDKEIKNKLQLAFGNIIIQLGLGERYADYDDPEYRLIMKGVADFSRDSLSFFVATIFPALLNVPPIKGKSMAVRRGLDKVVDLFKNIIAEHEKVLDESEPRDLIDEYLLEMRRHQCARNGPFSKDMLACVIRDLLGAGMETVSSTIIFSCLVLANRPEIMKKIQKEIDDVVGKEGKVEYAMREKMPCCHSVIMEVMRFRSAVPLSVLRSTSENTILGDYNIRKGTWIMANLYAVHNNPEYWENPEEFMPERHIGSDGKIVISKYWLPFGVGPRKCIGRRLAEMQTFIFFVSLLQRYDVLPTPTATCDRPPVQDYADTTGITLCPPDNTPVTLVRRK